MKLTINNFFRCYMFHSCAKELSPQARCQAKILSVVLAIFTLGIIHYICRIAFYKRFVEVISPAKVSRISHAAKFRITTATAHQAQIKLPPPLFLTNPIQGSTAKVESPKNKPKGLLVSISPEDPLAVSSSLTSAGPQSNTPKISPKASSAPQNFAPASPKRPDAALKSTSLQATPPSPPTVFVQLSKAPSQSASKQVPSVHTVIVYQLDTDPNTRGKYQFNVQSTNGGKQSVDAPLIRGKTGLINAEKILIPANAPILASIKIVKEQEEAQKVTVQGELDMLNAFIMNPGNATFSKQVKDLLIEGKACLQSDVHQLQKKKSDLEAEIQRINKEKGDLEEDRSKVSAVTKAAIAKKVATLNTAPLEAQLKNLRSEMDPQLETIEAWKYYINNPDTPLPSSIRQELETLKKGCEKTIQMLTESIPRKETFLQTRSIVDYIPIELQGKVKQLPNFTRIPGANLTSFLSVGGATGVATFYPTFNTMGQEVVCMIAFDDAGTQIGSGEIAEANPKSNVSIQSKGQNPDWNLAPLTDEQMQGIIDDDPKCLDQAMANGLNIFIFKLKSPLRFKNLNNASIGTGTLSGILAKNNKNHSASQHEHEYIPSTALFIRMTGIGCMDVNSRSGQVNLTDKILKLGERITAAGDARLDSLI